MECVFQICWRRQRGRAKWVLKDGPLDDPVRPHLSANGPNASNWLLMQTLVHTRWNRVAFGLPPARPGRALTA